MMTHIVAFLCFVGLARIQICLTYRLMLPCWTVILLITKQLITVTGATANKIQPAWLKPAIPLMSRCITCLVNDTADKDVNRYTPLVTGKPDTTISG